MIQLFGEFHRYLNLAVHVSTSSRNHEDLKPWKIDSLENLDYSQCAVFYVTPSGCHFTAV
mgnify:CR=1 FL=1